MGQIRITWCCSGCAEYLGDVVSTFVDSDGGLTSRISAGRTDRPPRVREISPHRQQTESFALSKGLPSGSPPQSDGPSVSELPQFSRFIVLSSPLIVPFFHEPSPTERTCARACDLWPFLRASFRVEGTLKRGSCFFTPFYPPAHPPQCSPSSPTPSPILVVRCEPPIHVRIARRQTVPARRIPRGYPDTLSTNKTLTLLGTGQYDGDWGFSTESDSHEDSESDGASVMLHAPRGFAPPSRIPPPLRHKRVSSQGQLKPLFMVEKTSSQPSKFYHLLTVPLHPTPDLFQRD